MWHASLLDLIGKTPLVELRALAKQVKPTVLVKVEYFNPGNSVKDRIALKMVEDAEKRGLLKPGGMIVECTSGNTGIGLAVVAALKGYRCVFTMSDKQSQEKVDSLRAFGAEVVICPTNVAPDDPRSYYSVARRIHAETPNSFFPNQYDNPANTQAHYETTGPELWEGTEGKITHFVCGMGTCGTISGVSKYLKERNPRIVSIGIDTYGSVFKKYKETGEFDKQEIYPYLTEGIGEDILPANGDFSLVDRVEKVADKDAFLMTRELARREGLFVGGSAGSAVVGGFRVAAELGKDDLIVILLPDHGSRYLGKIFNDAWMKSHGFLDGSGSVAIRDILKKRGKRVDLISVQSTQTLAQAAEVMNARNVSQLPVMDGDEVVGSLTETKLLNVLLEHPASRAQPVRSIMNEPFPLVMSNTTIETLIGIMSRERPAVLVQTDDGELAIVTRYDLVSALSL